MAVAEHITDGGKAGKLRPGSRLPPERELAERYGAAYMTIRRAMRELRERVVVSVHGRGTFVAERSGG